MIREPIYAAILSQLEKISIPGLTLYCSRDFKLWDSVQTQPAILIQPETETAEFKRGLPLKWTLHVALWIYTRRQGDSLGVQQLNPIMDAIEAIFGQTGQPPNQAVNTLGGLVYSCWLNGPVMIDGGYLEEGQVIAKMGLEIIQA